MNHVGSGLFDRVVLVSLERLFMTFTLNSSPLLDTVIGSQSVQPHFLTKNWIDMGQYASIQPCYTRR